MAKHIIIGGHRAGDPGALMGNWSEVKLFDQFYPNLKKYAGMLKNNTVEFYDLNKNIYYETQKGAGAHTLKGKYASATEIHWDAGTKNVSTGGHVIIGGTADATDTRIKDVINKYFGVSRTGGFSLRRDLLVLNVFFSSTTSYRLVEMGYVTNTKDVDKFLKNKDAVAKELIEAITGEKIQSKPVTETPKPAPKPTPAPKPKPKPVVPKPPTTSNKGKWIAEKGTFYVGRNSGTSLPTIKVASLPLTVNATGKGAKIADISREQAVKYDAFMNDGTYIWIRQPRGKGYGYMATGDVKNGKRANYWGKFV